MHYKKYKGILSAHNGMNLFRGCIHGCIYCDSRSKCYQMDHEFTDIEIKENAIELLETTLSKKRKKCMIGMGSMTDPYMNIKETLLMTRKSLEVIYKYGFGVTLITKSARVLDDLDLLIKINERSKCVVQMTLTTYNDDLCKIVEPHASLTSERIKALQILHENNIPTVVWLTPILPYINDNLPNLQGLLNECLKAGVYGFITFGFGLTLREGDREYYYEQLDKYFPGLKEIYQKKYGLSYEIPSPNNDLLTTYYESFCKTHHLHYKSEEVFNYLNNLDPPNQLFKDFLI